MAAATDLHNPVPLALLFDQLFCFKDNCFDRSFRRFFNTFGINVPMFVQTAYTKNAETAKHICRLCL